MQRCKRLQCKSQIKWKTPNIFSHSVLWLQETLNSYLNCTSIQHTHQPILENLLLLSVFLHLKPFWLHFKLKQTIFEKKLPTNSGICGFKSIMEQMTITVDSVLRIILIKYMHRIIVERFLFRILLIFPVEFPFLFIWLSDWVPKCWFYALYLVIKKFFNFQIGI